MKKNLAIFVTLSLFSCNQPIEKSQPAEKKDASKAVVLSKPDSKYLSQSQLIDFLTQVHPLQHTTSKYHAAFDTLKFDKVVAYDFDDDEGTYPAVLDKKTKSFNPVTLQQAALNTRQIDELSALITDTATYGEGIATCFRPHLAAIFYFKTINWCMSKNAKMNRHKI